MCVACVEFIKETLTFKEFQSALREVTRDSEAQMEGHVREIDRIVRQNPGNDAEIRKQLKTLAPKR